jgi:hypothetical protein
VRVGCNCAKDKSGQRPDLPVNGLKFDTGGLPVQQLANAAGLSLARNELLLVRERDQPSLAAQDTHLPDVIDIHQRVPVNSSKIRVPQPLFQDLQSLGGEVFPLCGNDPHSVAIRLECAYFVGAKKKVFLADLPHDPSGTGRGRLVGDLL